MAKPKKYNSNCLDCDIEIPFIVHSGTHLCEGCLIKMSVRLKDKYGDYNDVEANP